MNDDTLTLTEAAQFCGVSKRQLVLDARHLGFGTKKTKSWRFIRSDLLNYLDPSYAIQRRALSSKEGQQCHTKGKEVSSGGSQLEEYAKALGLTISTLPRHSKTS